MWYIGTGSLLGWRLRGLTDKLGPDWRRRFAELVAFDGTWHYQAVVVANGLEYVFHRAKNFDARVAAKICAVQRCGAMLDTHNAHRKNLVMVDVNLKIPALEMLLKYSASGIGAVAGPMLATWKARQTAKATIIEVEAETESLKLIADAQSEARHSLIDPDSAGKGRLEITPDGIRQRIDFQECKRQANIVSTIQEAASNLGEREVPNHEPDPDWTARFFDCVQDVSSADMRMLWSKMLSGEVESPGRTTLRTLESLRNLTSREARIFNEVCKYVIFDFIPNYDNVIGKYDHLSYDNLLLLEDAGLVNASLMLLKSIGLNDLSNSILTKYGNLILKIESKNESKKIEIGQFLLTPAGKELHGIMNVEHCMKYVRDLAIVFGDLSCNLSFAPIISKIDEESFRYGPFVSLDP